MRIMWAFSLVLLGCSSTPLEAADAGDAGDAGCPPGPFSLGAQAGDNGVPADPNTGACPADYCFKCEVLDWAQGCSDLICLKTDPKSQASPGQCSSLCDAGTDASADAATSD